MHSWNLFVITLEGLYNSNLARDSGIVVTMTIFIQLQQQQQQGQQQVPSLQAMQPQQPLVSRHVNNRLHSVLVPIQTGKRRLLCLSSFSVPAIPILVLGEQKWSWYEKIFSVSINHSQTFLFCIAFSLLPFVVLILGAFLLFVVICICSFIALSIVISCLVGLLL